MNAKRRKTGMDAKRRKTGMDVNERNAVMKLRIYFTADDVECLKFFGALDECLSVEETWKAFCAKRSLRMFKEFCLAINKPIMLTRLDNLL